MEYSLTTVVDPASLAISLSQAKLQVRVEADEDYEDTYLTELIEDATDYVEEMSDVTFVERTYELKLPCFPPCSNSIYLPRPPLVSVASVKYFDEDNAEQTLSTDVYEVIDGDISLVQKKPDQIWPTIRSRPDAVTIRYVSGTGVPKKARRAIQLLVGHWYKNREDAEVPDAVDRLIELIRPGDEFKMPF